MRPINANDMIVIFLSVHILFYISLVFLPHQQHITTLRDSQEESYCSQHLLKRNSDKGFEKLSEDVCNTYKCCI